MKIETKYDIGDQFQGPFALITIETIRLSGSDLRYVSTSGETYSDSTLDLYRAMELLKRLQEHPTENSDSTAAEREYFRIYADCYRGSSAAPSCRLPLDVEVDDDGILRLVR